MKLKITRTPMSEHLFDMKETRKSIHYIDVDNKEGVATFIECVGKQMSS